MFLFTFRIVVDVINGMQGVLIFVVLIIGRRRIRQELGGKQICCCRAPASWAEIDMPEEAHLNVEEDKGSYRAIYYI